jgi:zinc protease
MTLHRRLPAVAAALVALGLAACSGGDQPHRGPEDVEAVRAAFEAADFPHQASDIPADPGVRYGVLSNGLRYAIMENDTPTGTAALRLVFNVGSLAEDDDQRGLAHFVEHMAFNGTTNVPEGEMVTLLERYGLAFGPDTNAFTGREIVGYQLDLPSNDEQLINIGLFLMRETASEVIMDAGAIDRERGVIMGEMRFRDTPVSRYFEALYDFHYPDTLITARNPIGVEEVIMGAGPEPFERYYRDFYTPERGFLVVVGDVNADEIEAKIRDGFPISTPELDVTFSASFADWAQPEEPRGDPEIGTVTKADEAEFGFFHDPDVFTIVNVDVITPGEALPDTRAARMDSLKRQLGNAILQRRIQSQINSGASALLQANASYTNEFGLANRAGILGVATPDRWREGVAVLENELRRAIEFGFTQAELNEQLANLRTALRNGADQADTRNSNTLADAIWSAWADDSVFAHPDFALAWFEGIESELTVEAIDYTFGKMWKAAPPRVFVALNQDLDDGPAAVREAWLSASAEPVEAPQDFSDEAFAYTDFGPAGAVASQTIVEDLNVTQITFENGVRLNVKPTDFEDSIIRVRVDFGAGSLTPQPTPAAGSILGAAFGGGGLEAHDRDALQRLFAGRSVGYGVGVADDGFFFSNATTPTDFELQMQVLTAFMTAPGWRDEGLNQFRGIAEEVRRGQNAQAVQVATNRVSRMLRNGDPRWGFPTAEEVDAFTMDHARTLLEPALQSAPVEITLVGDITVETAIEVVAATFGALPPRDESWPDYAENAVISFPEPTAEPVIVRYNGEPESAMANTYFPTGDGMDPERRVALALMRGVYNLKATDRFREEEGATYSAIVSGQYSRVFEGYGFLWVGLDVTRTDIPAMYQITDEIAASMAAGEISEDELQRARQPILESLEESLERNPYWLGALSRSQAEPQKLDDLRTARERYEAVTVEDIAALSAEVLDPAAAYRVTILAEGAEAP